LGWDVRTHRILQNIITGTSLARRGEKETQRVSREKSKSKMKANAIKSVFGALAARNRGQVATETSNRLAELESLDHRVEAQT